MLKKVNYNNIVLTLTLILPFLDIYRALIGNKYQLLGISLVEILNFIFTFVIIVVFIIKSKKENNKIFSPKSIPIILIYILYICIHTIYIMSLTESGYINANASVLTEIYYILRTCLLPLMILFTFIKFKFNSKDIINTLSKISFIFSLIIVITNIFNISLVAYSSDYEGIVPIQGNIFSWFNGLDINSIDLYTSRGLFYSTNQVSAILGALLFISAFHAFSKDKLTYYISFFIKILAALMLSTKTAFFAIILSILAIYIYLIIKYILCKKNEFRKKGLLFVVFLTITLIIYNYSPIKYKLVGYLDNLKDNTTEEWTEKELSSCVSMETLQIQEENNLEIKEVYKKEVLTEIEKQLLIGYINDCPKVFDIPEPYIKFYPIKENFEFWISKIKEPISELSNYRSFKNTIYENFISKHNNILDRILGIGYASNFPYMEIDFIAQLVWFGYIGIILFLIPYIIILIFNLIKLIILLKEKLNTYSVSLALASIFMVFASLFAGHVFGIFLTSTIFTLLICGLHEELKTKVINNNKVTFLVLHLGYGGIETSTINTVNSLIDRYNVEIISFYNLKNNQEDKVNDKIKIKYLYNGGPNKEEFIRSLKEHKYGRTLIEGIKAISILIKKKLLIIINIIKCDSKYIISTRYDFSILLSKYGNQNSMRIAQEHHYHNDNKKYINILAKKYKNIDYLFALTKRLEEDYKKILKNNNHTKVVLVPNMLYNISDKNSLLDEKNIITVSRLDYGKKNDDIIRAFSKIDNKEWKLYIIGDGNEMNNLSKLIDELGLNNRVFLEGYKNKQEIEKYMLKSSLFLMASLTEGLPMVLLEAMSYGVPCIAYETASGTNDIISNNKNGYIIKNRNEEEYIEKINTIVKKDKLRKTFGINSKETSKSFSKEEITKIWYKILK